MITVFQTFKFDSDRSILSISVNLASLMDGPKGIRIMKNTSI